jgi:uncharacterized protein YprB with RNaseH-like and TPR domain
MHWMADRDAYMLRVRMSEVERDMLARLAEADGVTASDVVRLYIRSEYAARFETRPRARAKR